MFKIVRKKDYEQLEQSVEILEKEVEVLQKRPFLISIERNKRVNRFTFVRDGNLVTIETMGLISDNIKDWKDKLLR